MPGVKIRIGLFAVDSVVGKWGAVPTRGATVLLPKLGSQAHVGA